MVNYLTLGSSFSSSTDTDSPITTSELYLRLISYCNYLQLSPRSPKTVFDYVLSPVPKPEIASSDEDKADVDDEETQPLPSLSSAPSEEVTPSSNSSKGSSSTLMDRWLSGKKG